MHAFPGPREELFDVACGLANALFVLDKGDAHKAFAMLAEAETRRYGYVGLLYQQLKWTAFAGLGVMLVLTPLQVILLLRVTLDPFSTLLGLPTIPSSSFSSTLAGSWRRTKR